ncbi:hypothetical protein ABBQ32_013988 [Trebouxia sp. C0010 RCD-2024]
MGKLPSKSPHGETDVEAAQNKQVSNIFYHKVTSFDRTTNQLILPSFLQACQGVPIHIYDSIGSTTFGINQKPDKHDWQAELHRFYCQFPELCGYCKCQPEAEQYDALWLRFLNETGMSNPSKQDLPDALQQWSSWAEAQPELCEHTQQLCYGPMRSVEVFDRARIENANSSTNATKGKKLSRNSVVLIMRVYGVHWAGHVQFF